METNNEKISSPEKTTLEWAREYVKAGFSVIPIKPRDKRPAIESWTPYQTQSPTDAELVSWFGNGSKNNIGIVTGAISGIAVVDMDSAEAVQFAKKHGFPITPLVKTGKGYHGYYQYRDGVRNFQKRDDLPGIDLRGDGGYVVAPPSVHPNGTVYRWMGGKSLDTLPLAELPPIVLSTNGEGRAPLKELYQGVAQGDRNQTLARLCGSWVNDKLSIEECLENARLWNEKNSPALPEREIQRTVESIYRKHHRGHQRGTTAIKENRPDTDPDAGIIMLDTVTPEEVEWLWFDHFALRKLAGIIGDPNDGKSHFTVDVAARITTNQPMPDGTPSVPGGAVFLTVEDGLSDTVVPRLLAAGADLSKVAALKFVLDIDGNPRFPTIEDVDRIEAACHKVQARLVVIDPLSAHVRLAINSHRDQHIRSAMAPLADMADRLGVAVLLVRHLNKGSGTKAIYRGLDSIGITGACRSEFLIARDPEDPEKRILACTKSNLAPVPQSISFSIEGPRGASRIVWGGVSGHSADALLSIPGSPDERSALDEAKAFLEDVLFAGEVEANKVQRQARGAGIKDATLRRAKQALGVIARKQDFKGGWVWALPEDAQESPKMLTQKDEHLGQDMSTLGDSGQAAGIPADPPVDVSNQPSDDAGEGPQEPPGDQYAPCRKCGRTVTCILPVEKIPSCGGPYLKEGG